MGCILRCTRSREPGAASVTACGGDHRNRRRDESARPAKRDAAARSRAQALSHVRASDRGPHVQVLQRGVTRTGVPDRRLLAERSDTVVLDRDTPAALASRHRLVQPQGRRHQRGAAAVVHVRPWKLHSARAGHVPAMRAMAYFGTLVFLVAATGRSSTKPSSPPPVSVRCC